MLPNQLIDSDDSFEARAETMLERARWAAGAFARFDRDRTLSVARAVAEAAASRAAHYGAWAVRESGFGVAEHKAIKNEITSTGFFRHYRNHDFVGKRVRAEDKIVEIPRPAGVVFALTPSTNPISTVYFKVMCALFTRNAIVLSPHPAVRECSVDAIDFLAATAEKAGAPDGAIQAVREPKLPLIRCLMASPKVDVILATGGSPMVRAAYSSGNPAIGVGPGNAPAFVDASADLARAAERIVESKSFDNSILCTNESVVVAEAAIADRLARELGRAGAHVCSEVECERLRGYLFTDQGFNIEALGKSATTIADVVGIRVAKTTRILVTPIARFGREEPLSREKLCPVLGFFRASGRDQGIAVSRALLRMGGAGHSAAIHSRDEAAIMAFAAAVPALRVVVNSPCSQGAAGFGTHLAPSFTIGTGFFGRSSVGENIGPEHLVNWTRIAYSTEESEPMGSFATVEPWHEHESEGAAPLPLRPVDSGGDRMRDEIRRLILEELRTILADRDR